MEYPTDLLLTEDKDIRLDATNDIATIGGRRQLEQSVALDVLDPLEEFIGGKLTGRNLGLLEERIRESLNADEQVEDVYSADVREYDRGSSTVIADIHVIDNDDFTLELST
jgi:hypothetical protein